VSRLVRTVGISVPAAETLLCAQSLYLLSLCIAGLHRPRERDNEPSGDPAVSPPQLAVLVPAHDERLAIADAVISILACPYPVERRMVIVIADNCIDDTARRARDAGAEVYERVDPQRPGKGQAVAWALERLAAERPDVDAVVMIDADCTADPPLLARLADTLAAGADAVQGAYLGSNPDASRAAALRWAGYALMNRVRPAGKDTLGLSCGLLGSGMAFTAGTLARVPWDAFSVTEDKEQHLRLVQAGVRVRFAPDAVVRSPMPTEQSLGETQQMRWESGNVALARRWVPALLRVGLRRRDVRTIHAAWELLIPPLSLLTGLQLGIGLLARITGRRRLTRLSNLGLAGLTGYVALGLVVAHAPLAVYRAMLGAPRLIGRRVGQYVGLARGRGHRNWQRTDRS
jgi:cellulose synthase/poly-beta-1,6-N-acetylglucosamine synthase-like glycosyltransferase